MNQNNIIVFDTNTLFVDSKDKSINGFDFRESFKKVITFIKENEIQNCDLYISQVTLDEIVNQKKVYISLMIKESQKYLDYFGLSAPEMPKNIREMVESLFKTYNFNVLENTFNLERIYNKVALSEHPFRKCTHASDLGFKDAIILENIISFIQKNQFAKKIIFFTMDNDFIEEKVKVEIESLKTGTSFTLVRDEDRLKEKLIEHNLEALVYRSVNARDLFNFLKDEGIDIAEVITPIKEIEKKIGDGVLKLLSIIKRSDGSEISLSFYYDCYAKEYIFSMDESDEKSI